MTAHTGFAVSPTSGGQGTTPQGTRLALGGLLAKDGSAPLAVRRGILFDGRGAVVAGTGGMSYEVRACVAVVMPSATQGPVVVPTSATVSVSTTPAPSSNSRIDVIWVRQRLLAADAGSDTTVTAEWGVSQGTASASPVAPTIPTGALEVARALVTAGASTTGGLAISQTHPWTAAVGAPVPVRNDTERATLTAYDGLLVNHLGRKTIERYDGTNWVATASGWQPWTPAWTAASTNPALGNGSLVGEWRDNGGLIQWWLQLTWGSTTTGGSGLWRFGLPAPSRAGYWSGGGHMFDSSASNRYPIDATRDTGVDLIYVWAHPTTAGSNYRSTTANTPVTWGSGDVLELSGFYRGA